MAHLWIPEADSEADIDEAGCDHETWSRRSLNTTAQIATSARLLCSTTPDGERWVVVGPPSVRVNGAALDTGIAVLRDRDELYANGVRMFFSTERLAVVAPYPGSDRPIPCARCRAEIVAASPAVTCPRCGTWHHQSEEFPCWTYAERCSVCDQPTALDTGFAWSPEEL